MTTPAQDPPMAASNEAQPDQLKVARAEGDAYGKALASMKEESGAMMQRAGHYTVVLVQEDAEGMYMLHGDGLVWSEAPEEANAHFEVAVADATDGRFVPGLDVQITLLREGQELWTTELPFLWRPFLYHYGGNAKVPGEGTYSVQVRIAAPTFMRHDPVNGKRYPEPVDVVFDELQVQPGRKPSPDAQPRGADTSCAGA